MPRRMPSMRDMLVPADTVALKGRMAKNQEKMEMLQDPMLVERFGQERVTGLRGQVGRELAAQSDTLRSAREAGATSAGWTKQGSAWRRGGETYSGTAIPESAEYREQMREIEEMRRRARGGRPMR